MNYLWYALIIIGLIAFVVILEIFSTRCPACGKMFARQIIKGRGRVDHMETSMDSVNIEGSRMCKCKFCGHEWSQRYSKRRSR